MLYRQITFISLLLLCISSFVHSNDQNRIIYRHQRQVQSNGIGGSSGTSASNSNNNQLVLPNQVASNPLIRSTLLANSIECKVDIQKYCMKNTGKLIDNLKALQCIDDLDNVSSFVFR
jgi:hypothetical protein